MGLLAGLEVCKGSLKLRVYGMALVSMFPCETLECFSTSVGKEDLGQAMGCLGLEQGWIFL